MYALALTSEQLSRVGALDRPNVSPENKSTSYDGAL